jgi:hypothetical protein
MADYVRIGYGTTKRNIRENGYRTAFGMNEEGLVLGFMPTSVSIPYIT